MRRKRRAWGWGRDKKSFSLTMENEKYRWKDGSDFEIKRYTPIDSVLRGVLAACFPAMYQFVKRRERKRRDSESSSVCNLKGTLERKESSLCIGLR